MDDLDLREWLLTNGLGSFASGTVCDAHTRTYHGWLLAALDPPGQKTLLLSRIDATIEVAGYEIDLGTNFWTSGAISPKGYQLLQSFHAHPVPTWVWGQQTRWQLSRRLLLPHGLQKQSAAEAAAAPAPAFCNRVLIQYRYEGKTSAILRLRPLVTDRDFHYQQHADPDLLLSQLIEPNRLLLQAKRLGWLGTPWQLSWTKGDYQPNGVWYWGYHYPEETKRGLADREDLYSPGCLTVLLQPGESVTLEARVQSRSNRVLPLLDHQTFEQALEQEQQRLTAAFAAVEGVSDRGLGISLWEKLLRAGDQFIAHRMSIDSPTVIAGYPWFNDWGRDTLIALPGLTLTTRRFAIAKGLLRTFGQYCQQGLIPNAFPDVGEQPFYNSLDAALWWVETLGLYLEASQDWAFLVEQYPIVWRIYKGLMAGTLYNIRVDAFDGLVTWDAPNVALTWMDAVVEEQPITPRRGKPIEINALWYSALCWARQWAERLLHEPEMDRAILKNQMRRYREQAEQVQASLQKFWNAPLGYLHDTIQPNDDPDPSIRPNAVIALSLAHCGFSELQGQKTLRLACDKLLTPYGLRSLSPDDRRYVGQYRGGIWQRDRAYHQGTVWSWLLGPFVRAWQRFYPEEPVPFDVKPLLHHFQHQACLGSISEIFNGDAPHAPRGAVAQAWSVAELIRHWSDLVQPEQPE